jgi:hypothetical protein
VARGEGLDGVARYECVCTICPRAIGKTAPPYGRVFACCSKAIRLHESSGDHDAAVKRVNNHKNFTNCECMAMAMASHCSA